MSSSRFFLILALILATVLSPVFTAPVPVPEDEVTPELEKRITHSGRGTYFYPGLGACGGTNGNGDKIVAISGKIYNGGHNCWQYVHITNTSNGKSTFAMVVDECPSCSAGSLDMSPATFKALDSNLGDGDIPVKWNYMPKGWHQ